jgi:hypothetical protein
MATITEDAIPSKSKLTESMNIDGFPPNKKVFDND